MNSATALPTVECLSTGVIRSEHLSSLGLRWERRPGKLGQPQRSKADVPLVDRIAPAANIAPGGVIHCAVINPP